MPIDTSITYDFKPHSKVADVDNMPPDLPEGHWQGHFKVTPKVSKESGIPMLMIQATADEALTDGNQEFEGHTTTFPVMLYEPTHEYYKNAMRTVKQMNELYEDLPYFDETTLANDPPSFASLVAWVEAFESQPRQFWTSLRDNKETGEKVTQVQFFAPKGSTPQRRQEEDTGDKPKKSKKSKG
jgi:hypothetical protein